MLLACALDTQGEAQRQPRTGTASPAARTAEHNGGAAEALYRDARQALNREDYTKAIELFLQISRNHLSSRYATDANYWRAFAHYRRGSPRDLRIAQEALTKQRKSYPNAPTAAEANLLEVRVAGELAKLGDVQAQARIRGSLKREAGHCSAEAQRERVLALNALAHGGAPRRELLARVLRQRDTCSIPLREAAVFLLVQRNEAANEATLVDVIRDDPAIEVKRAATFWLSSLPTNHAVLRLDEIARTAPEPTIVDAALHGLAAEGSARALNALRVIATGRGRMGPHAQEKAVIALAERRSDDDLDWLRQLYETTRSERVKTSILAALGVNRRRVDQGWILSRAADPDEAVSIRRAAIAFAGEHGAPMTELVRLYDELVEVELKEALLAMYFKRREKEALDKLFAVARHEPNPRLRSAAAQLLAESGDPRAAELLDRLPR